MSEPDRKRRRRGRRALTAAFVFALAAAIWWPGWLQEFALERGLGYALGAHVDVDYTACYGREKQALRLARIEIRPTADSPPLLLAQGFELEYALFPKDRRHFPRVAVSSLEISAENRNGISNYAFLSGGGSGGAPSPRRILRYVPKGVSIDTITASLVTDTGKMELGGAKLEASIRTLFDFTGALYAPELLTVWEQAGDAGEPVLRSGDGRVRIAFEGSGGGVRLTEAALYIPGLAELVGAASAQGVFGGVRAEATLVDSAIEGERICAVLQPILPRPVHFGRAVIEGSNASLLYGRGGIVFENVDARLRLERLRIGPEESPDFDGDLVIEASGQGETVEIAARVNNGPRLASRFTGALRVADVRMVLEPCSRAELLAAIPGTYRPYLAAIPGLETVGGELEMKWTNPSYEASLHASPTLKTGPAQVSAQWRGSVDGRQPLAQGTARLDFQEGGSIQLGFETDVNGALIGVKAEPKAFRPSTAAALMNWEVLPADPSVSGVMDIRFGRGMECAFDLDVADLLLPVDIPALRNVTVSGKLSYDQAKGRVDFRPVRVTARGGSAVTFDELLFVPAPLSVNGRFTMQNALDLVAAWGYIDHADGTLIADGEVSYVEDAIRLDAKLSGDWTELALAEQLAVFQGATVRGAVSWDGRAQAELRVEAANVVAAGVTLRGVEGPIAYDGAAIVAGPVTGRIFNGKATVSATVLPGEEGAPVNFTILLEDVDLAIFTEEFQPPGATLTGLAGGTISGQVAGGEITALEIHLAAPEGITINRDLVRSLLLAQYVEGAPGAKKIRAAIDQTIGEAEQRPFDSAAIDLRLEGARLVGEAPLKSKNINLTLDLRVDLAEIYALLELQQEARLENVANAGLAPVQSTE